MGNKFPDHAPALQRTNRCTINAKTHSSYPARAKDQSEWSLRPRPGAVAPIDGSIVPSAVLRQDNSDGEIDVLCPAGSIDVSSCAEILLTHNCTRGCLVLVIRTPFRSPRIPSWTPGAWTPFWRSAAAASVRRTWRPAAWRGWRRAASARRGTPRCRRACPLCT
uniref:Uncharacterized protein n=1 Tax=Zea mays TaxID=4577 RepID=C0PAP4_MAIZE|nr:unknown [Zea mays]